MGGRPFIIRVSLAASDPSFEAYVPLSSLGDRYGAVADPYGHRWSIATHLRDVAPEEMERVVKGFAHAGA